jgi:hypothetical protein
VERQSTDYVLMAEAIKVDVDHVAQGEVKDRMLLYGGPDFSPLLAIAEMRSKLGPRLTR